MNSHAISATLPTNPHLSAAQFRQIPFARRMQNPRFYHIEQSILDIVAHSKTLLSVRVIAHRAHISPSTFYRHHQNSHTIIPDLEQFLFQKYRKLIYSFLKSSNTHIQSTYLQTLIFILKNQEVFALIESKDSGHLLEQMFYLQVPKIAQTYHLPTDSPTISHVYAKEIAGVLEVWVESNFKASINEVLSDMMALTEDLRQHLSTLARQ